jgi:uncharacterized protein DUF6457
METNAAAAVERAWLEAVGRALGPAGEPLASPGDAEVRSLLRVTKIVSDVTGVRYLAPLTSYLLGVAAGRAGDGFDLQAAVEKVSALAEGWTPPMQGG